jgi:uncharacterized tellurite resistance protein B-like protein
MGILDLYQSNAHRNNVAHFATIVTIALVDGELNEDEMIFVNRFRRKLDITNEEYDLIMTDPTKYPLVSYSSYNDRLEHLFDLFKIIYADHKIEESEKKILLKYAIGLGFTSEKAASVVKKSIRIFDEGIDFDHYSFLIDKRSTE